MFCLKCGNQLKESDRFCAKCGAPVVERSEPQEKPAAEPVYSQAPAAGRAEAQPVNYWAAASVQKKSKKGLIIGLSVGIAVLLIVAAAVALFASGMFSPKTSIPGTFDSETSNTEASGLETLSPEMSNPETSSLETPSAEPSGMETSNPEMSKPFPMLDVGNSSLYIGQDISDVQKEFPEMKHDSHIIYRLTPPSELYACFRENKETGETKLVRWSTYVQNTGIVNGVHIGDSYEKILAEYPKAMSSQETSSDGKSKYDPQKDTSTQFSVFINKNGNIYSDNEYREMWFSTITSGDKAVHEQMSYEWYSLVFNVNNGMVTGIAFGDMQSTKLV